MKKIKAERQIITIALLFIFSIMFSYAQAGPDERIYSIYVNVIAVVDDAEKQGKIIVDYTESAGGYYLRHSDKDVSLRLPKKYFQGFEDCLKNSSTIIEYNVRTEDLENDYLLLKKQVSAREKILSDLTGMINSANLNNTLSLEKEIMSLLYEIERIKGRIRMIEAEAASVRIDVYFASDSFSRPVKTESSFNWINTVDFYSFITPED